jgi:hypothetical protein
MFEITPTANAPTAAEMSFWFGKTLAVKWFEVQPALAMATRRI